MDRQVACSVRIACRRVGHVLLYCCWPRIDFFSGETFGDRVVTVVTTPITTLDVKI